MRKHCATPYQPGLVNLLQGDGDVGAKLTGHANVDMVGFTGSTATGQKILNTASKTSNRSYLECGGKDPMVVLEDADLELAAHDAVAYSLANCGQVCCVPSASMWRRASRRISRTK